MSGCDKNFHQKTIDKIASFRYNLNCHNVTRQTINQKQTKQTKTNNERKNKMTTFKTTHAFTSANDFSAEMVKEFTGNYIVRGKAIDVDSQDPMKLFNRNRWVMERIGRVLDVSGKLDPETTSFRIDRDENKTIHIRFIDVANGDTLYTLDVNNTEDDRNYVLRDSSGNEVVTSMKWTGIKKYFAPLPSSTTTSETTSTSESINETPIAEAAAPVKNSSESSPTTTEEESLDDLTSIPDEL